VSGIEVRALFIPKRYAHCTLENFEGYPNYVEAVKKAVDSGSTIFLHGNCGSGKTHLAVGALVRWTLRNRPSGKHAPRFLSSVDFFAELKASFDGKTDMNEESIVRMFAQKPVLLIDDVGAEKVSDWSRQVFYRLIDLRYRDCLPTYLTSNLSLDGIGEKMDDRIASRMVSGLVLKVDAPDFRIKQRV